MSAPEDMQWSQPEQLDQLVPMQDIDFSNFLDIGDIDLTNFTSLEQDHQIGAHHGQQPPNTPYNNADMSALQTGHSTHDFATDNFEMPIHMGQDQMMQGSNNGSNHGSTADLRDLSGAISQSIWNPQQQLQQQDPMNTFRPPNHIPPTPNSYDLHGGDPGRYLQQQMDSQTQAFLEQRYQLRNDEFTPLVSPAVTPQDSQFQSIPEYTVPGAYFSPLTSPALQAQNARQQYQSQHGHLTQPSTAGSSTAASPINSTFDFDMLSTDGMSLPEPARRSSRKLQAPRSVGPVARVRHSPIVKPRKRKSVTLSSLPARDFNDIVREAPRSQPGTGTLSQGPVQSTDSSGPESISPEPLSDALMGPPPRPGSTLNSPHLMPDNRSATASINGHNSGAPATPASLMSIDKSQRGTASRNRVYPHSAQPLGMSHHDFGLEDFVLPPSAATQNTEMTSADTTPRITAARKTPKLGPLATASSGVHRTMSATSSPYMQAMNSPMSAITPTGKGTEKLGKGGKKRGSISTGSSIASPALRPKISPSIKPLLPGGEPYTNLNDSQHALLLASKSNYTHLLEGTSLPGVSYPESLSSGLTSKRTSHKIAEQGRRNRINEALKEMQGLLPAQPKDKHVNDNNSGDGEDSKDSPKNGSASSEAKAANSKAATVESAIDYIKSLQRHNAEMAMALQNKEEEMTVLRRQFQTTDIDRDDSSTSPSSVSVKAPSSTETQDKVP